MQIVRGYRHTAKPEELKKVLVEVSGQLVSEDASLAATLYCAVPHRVVDLPIYIKGTHPQDQMDQQVAAGVLKKVWVFRHPLDTPDFARTEMPYDLYDSSDIEEGNEFKTPVGSLIDPGNPACASFENDNTLTDYLAITSGGVVQAKLPVGASYIEADQTYNLSYNYKVSDHAEHWYYNADDYAIGKTIYDYPENQKEIYVPLDENTGDGDYTYFTYPSFRISSAEWEKLQTQNEGLVWATAKATSRTGQFKIGKSTRDSDQSASDLVKRSLDTYSSLVTQLDELKLSFQPEVFQANLNSINAEKEPLKAQIETLESAKSTELLKSEPDQSVVDGIILQIQAASLAIEAIEVRAAAEDVKLIAFINSSQSIEDAIAALGNNLFSSTGVATADESFNQKLFKQDAFKPLSSTSKYNNLISSGNFPRQPDEDDGTRNDHTWGDFGSVADSHPFLGGLGYSAVATVQDFEWPDALAYTDTPASPPDGDTCSSWGVTDYGSWSPADGQYPKGVTDLYLGADGKWSRFCGWGYGVFPFPHTLRQPTWQSVRTRTDGPGAGISLRRTAEFGPICTGGANAGRNATCFTYNSSVTLNIPPKATYDLNTYRGVDYFIADQEYFYDLLDKFMAAGPIKGFDVSTDLSIAEATDIADIHPDFVFNLYEALRLRYAAFDWKPWFTEPGMMFEAYAPTDPDIAIPVGSLWAGAPPTPVITPPDFAPGDPTDLRLRIIVSPGIPKNLTSTKALLPGIPTDSTLTKALLPGAPTDLALEKALLPGIPTDLTLEKALLPGAPTDLTLEKALLPGIPTDLTLTKALLPGIPTDLTLEKALLPGIPTDLTLTKALLPGIPTDLTLTKALLPGIPTDLTLTKALLPGIPTDLALKRLINPGTPIVNGLRAYDTLTNAFIVNGEVSNGSGSVNSGGELTVPISLYSPFGSPIFNFTNAQIQTLSNGAITVGGFYAIEVLPNRPPRLVLAEELTF